MTQKSMDNSNSIDHLKSVIYNQLDIFTGICQLSANTKSLLEKEFELLTNESLNQPVNETYMGLSRINSNGFPFQWSLNLGKQPPSVRFLCEVGTPGTSAVERVNLSFQKIALLTDLLSFDYPEWLFDSVIPRILPTKIPDHWLSALWFAVGANDEGILPKVYFNLNQGTILDRWKSVGWVLKDMNRELSLRSLCEISTVASQESLPVGIAFDLMSNGEPGRVKIYFRSTKADMKFLERWYQSCNAERYSPKVRNFLDCFPCDNKFPNDSFVISLEFPPETIRNWNPTLKLDIGITKWMKGDSQIRDGILRALGILDIPANLYLNFLDKLGPSEMSKQKCIFHRFAGIGYENDNTIHMNVYFEPFISTLPIKSVNQTQTSSKKITVSSPKEKINESITNGLRFLADSQRSNGSWADFHLPVGESDTWVTAYVLYQLSSLQKNIQYTFLNNCRYQALDWLQIMRKKTGGWSYNSSVEEDSDSTSLAILATSTMNYPVLEKSFNRLLLYFTKEGGVSTYLDRVEEGGTWSIGHCDVTPFALLALNERLPLSIRQKVLDFLVKEQRDDGLWPSYWWTSPLYATYASLTWFSANQYDIPLKKTLIQTLNGFNPSGSFEIALHLDCIKLLKTKRNERYMKDMLNLLDAQLPNGSWPSSSILRLTYSNVDKPWMKLDSGPTYRDIKNIFTTATVIGTLLRTTFD